MTDHITRAEFYQKISVIVEFLADALASGEVSVRTLALQPERGEERWNWRRALISALNGELPPGDRGAEPEAGESRAWRDINTAPRDGSPFLVFLPQAAWEQSLKPAMTVMYWAPWENFASLYADRIGETEGDAGDWGPTHWMPLPGEPLQQPSQYVREPGTCHCGCAPVDSETLLCATCSDEHSFSTSAEGVRQCAIDEIKGHVMPGLADAAIDSLASAGLLAGPLRISRDEIGQINACCRGNLRLDQALLCVLGDRLQIEEQ